MHTHERQNLFEQTVALLAANGMPVNDQIKALMEPLLSGAMTHDEHRVMLQAMMEELKS